MKLPAGLNRGLEAAINRYLGLDPESRDRLAGLEGRTIALEFRGIELQLVMRVEDRGVRIITAAEQAADTVLRGNIFGMARLGLGGNASRTLFSGDVEIRGDVETGQTFKAILDEMDIDWEEQLSRLTGDMIAHRMGNAARSTGQWLEHSRATLEQDLSEYLQEELRVLPTRIEIENFSRDVDALAMTTERAAARLRRLQANRGER